MKRATILLSIALVLTAVLQPAPVSACTNFLITKGASADGSTMITYAADSHVLYGELYFTPAGRHAPGTMIDVYEWDTGKYLGKIPQAPVTYTAVGNINEHQVAIGETTWGGRSELRDPEAKVDYGSLMYLALQRSKTAREAIEVMTSLVAEHGYYSSGETFSISDPNEVWIMDMIGKGPGNTGAVWVARLVPDGYISAHANAARIRQFPQNDPETLFAPDTISFARDKGWFDGDDADFNFAETYSPPDYGANRFCDARVWCMFNRARPSDPLPSDWVTGQDGAEPLPLWIKADRKLTVADVLGYMRDHFEGTELDMTEDIGAGPYERPYRWRPLTWKAGDKRYFNERATATQQTGFSFLAQCRSWLPAPIGGILWFSVDDAASTVYFPVYCGVTEVPYNYAVGTGSWTEFTWDSAFWVFNWVSNYTYLRYNVMIEDVRIVQRQLEAQYMAEVADIDGAAVALYQQAPKLARDYLTCYSKQTGEALVKRWKKLGEELLFKYLDGNTKDELGNVTHPGYPESWYAKVAAATGEKLEMIQLAPEKAAAEKAEAEAKAKAEGIRAAIYTLLDSRGIVADEAAREKIDATEDLEKLGLALVNAAVADDAAHLVPEGPAAPADSH
jgi:dipeptidase